VALSSPKVDHSGLEIGVFGIEAAGDHLESGKRRPAPLHWISIYTRVAYLNALDMPFDLRRSSTPDVDLPMIDHYPRLGGNGILNCVYRTDSHLLSGNIPPGLGLLAYPPSASQPPLS
jgi:hypothetical protein